MRARDFDRDEFLSKTWPEALESGEFKKGEGQLLDKRDNTYCCLGVACELLSRLRLLPRTQWHPGASGLPDKAAKLLDIDPIGEYHSPKGSAAYGSNLANDNDDGQTFKRIAKTIRRVHKAGLFQRPE